jgi:DNA (cytosine-5)-methyltransferase 1
MWAKVKKELRVLDLFAGAGGFSQGFHWAGFATAVAIDHNATAVETLEANFGHLGAKALVRDLSTFRPEDLDAYLAAHEAPRGFDVIIGGPPCQGWSSVGRGKIRSLRNPGGRRQEDSDPRNELYKNFLRFVEFYQPAAAVMENVPGMLSHNGKNVAERVAESLSDLGYTVSWELLDASALGVPQVRKRLFFVGIRSDLRKTFVFPHTHTEAGRRVYPEVTVKDAIGDLPIIRNGARDWVRPYKPHASLSDFAKRMRQDADPATIFDHVCRMQNDQDLEAFRLMKEGGWYRDLPKHLKRYREDIFQDKYKKLFWDKPSWCVTAHLSKDCYTHIHPSQTRTISVREAARLQSFPDCFYFAGSMGAKFQLIGNAVPPLLAERIATAVRDQVLDAPRVPARLRTKATRTAASATV